MASQLLTSCTHQGMEVVHASTGLVMSADVAWKKTRAIMFTFVPLYDKAHTPVSVIRYIPLLV